MGGGEEERREGEGNRKSRESSRRKSSLSIFVFVLFYTAMPVLADSAKLTNLTSCPDELKCKMVQLPDGTMLQTVPKLFSPPAVIAGKIPGQHIICRIPGKSHAFLIFTFVLNVNFFFPLINQYKYRSYIFKGYYKYPLFLSLSPRRQSRSGYSNAAVRPSVRASVRQSVRASVTNLVSNR